MVNNDKVRIMTKIQLFEEQEKEALKANRFFQRDYLGLYMIRSFFAYIVLFILIVAVLVLYHWEGLLTQTDMAVLMQLGKGLLISFVLLLIPSMVMSYIVYWFKYRKCRKKVKEHIENLKQLNNFYQMQDEKRQKNDCESMK